MKKYELLRSIAEEFHIGQGNTESDEHWKARVIYSLLGQMARASLMDREEDHNTVAEVDESVSITHFKQKVSTVLYCYQELYPEIHSLFPEKTEDLCNEIYDIFLKSGCLYHTPFRILSAAPCYAQQGGLQFERGMPLERKQYISGLGAYLPVDIADNRGNAYSSVQEMFGLQVNTLSEAWSILISTAIWQSMPRIKDWEYLFHGSFAHQWRNLPEKEGIISIARIGSPGGRLYYLYQIKDGQLLGSQIPQWLVDDPFYGSVSYRSITCSCLNSTSSLPKIKFKIDGSIVYVHIQCLLPPAEFYWLKLYSWPNLNNRFPSDFKRIFCRNVFQVIKDVLEAIGYQFTEE